MPDVTTRIYRASQIEQLRASIVARRYRAELKQWQKDLAAYHKRRHGRKEVERKIKRPTVPDSFGEMGAYVEAMLGERLNSTRTGFEIKRHGFTEFVERPELRGNWEFWEVHASWRSGTFTMPRRETGLVADGGRFNRALLSSRVEKYHDTMQAGEWRDLLSDPISVTDDGEVINGQHRLAAMEGVDWEKAGNNPAFLVVFGVDPSEVVLTDASKRTGRDMAVIAAKNVTPRSESPDA